MCILVFSPAVLSQNTVVNVQGGTIFWNAGSGVLGMYHSAKVLGRHIACQHAVWPQSNFF